MSLVLSVSIGLLIGTAYGILVTIIDFASRLAEWFPVLRVLASNRLRQFAAQILLVAVAGFLFGLAFNDPRLSWVLVGLGTVVGGGFGWQLVRRLLVRD